MRLARHALAALAAVVTAGCLSTAPPPPATTPSTTAVPAAAVPPTTVPVAPEAPSTATPTTPPTPTTAPPTTAAPTTTAPPTTAPPVAPVERDTHVVYSTRSDPSAAYQIERMRADGTGRVRLTADPTRSHNWARPSPDGSRILFYKAAPTAGVNDIDTNSLWVMDADGTDQRELIPDGAYGWARQGHAEWSPDGTMLVMAAGTTTLDAWTTDAEGRNPRRLTDRRNVLGAPLGLLDTSWAPDGRSILYVACPTDRIFCFWWDNEVFIRNLATGVERRLTNDGFADFDPYLSPDGSTVVFLRCTGTFPFGPWAIMRVPVAGGTPAQPVLDDGQVNSNVDFSHDGTTLLFSRHQIGQSTWMTAARVGMDGSGLGFVGGRPAQADQVVASYWP